VEGMRTRVSKAYKSTHLQYSSTSAERGGGGGGGGQGERFVGV
jgi:hypothetical protein